MKPNLRSHFALSLSVLAIGLAGCGGSGGSNNNNVDDDDGGAALSLFVANDQGADNGTVDQFSASSSFGSIGTVSQTTYDLDLAEGIVLDRLSNLYQTGIDGNGALKVSCSTAGSSATAGGMTVAFDAQIDRTIANNAALGTPKGMDIAQNAGVVIIADNSNTAGAGIQVFSTTAGPGAAALFQILPTGAGAWDISYDESTDRLFAALVNGNIAYYADFLATQGATEVLFNPTTALATSNMHGIDYDGSTDRLVVTDVAVPAGGAFNTDGSIYSFMNASTLAGAVVPTRTIQGATNTGLGNPVDIQLIGDRVLVAEKTNGGSLRAYYNIFTGTGAPEDVSANRVVATAAGSPPESIALRDDGLGTDAEFTDINGETINFVFVSSNPGAATGNIRRFDPNLISEISDFVGVTGAQDTETLALDQNGDGILSFDNAGAGGLSFINRLALRADGTALDAPNTDRQILGAATTLIAPKGVEVASQQGGLFVADLNAAAPGGIKFFSLCAAGNVAPVINTPLPAGTRPWDMDYDAAADRLFVAATNGTVLVYDNYLGGANPDTATPDRIIDPNDATGGASNLHGIIHVAETNQLILSDVGVGAGGAFATDGRLYVINNASSADGPTPVRLEIAGPATLLGNPVDIAFDGTNLYVAEKANSGGLVLRFDNILSLTGLINMAADRGVSVPNPESVALSADFLPAP